MRTAFYLPTVTPWWFDNIVAPLIRAMAAEHDVHVLVTPLWCNTGIDGDQLIQFEDCPDIVWHILDGEDHPKLRLTTVDEADLIALMTEINPDIVLCRTADRDIAQVFPGTVRYITEGAAPPFPVGPARIVLEADMFHHGRMPALDAEQKAELERFIDPIWKRQKQELKRLPDWRAAAGVTRGRKVVALPLQYEHAENFYARHSLYPNNLDMLEDMAGMMGEDIFLAVTNHPLNDLHADNRPLKAIIAGMNGRAALIDAPRDGVSATEMVAADCDGAIIDLTKSFAIFAMNGVPMLRRSSFPAAAWLESHDDPAAFFDGVHSGTLEHPSEADAKTWFAFHFANSAFDPESVYLEAAEIIDRAQNPVNPKRWAENMDRYARFHEDLFVC